MSLSAETFGGYSRSLPVQEAARTVTSPKPEKPSSLDEMAEALTQPQNLKEGHDVGTPFGVWHMDGKIAIFDAKKTAPKALEVTHVDDFDTYVSKIVEDELAVREHVDESIPYQPVRRNFLQQVKYVAAAVATSIGGI